MENICSRCNGDKNINGFVKKKLYCKKCANEYCRQYKMKNKEKIAEYNKKYKSVHVNEIKNYNADYNKKNRNVIQERHTAYLREKRKNDPEYKISTSLRNRVNKVIKGQKKLKTLEMLGCSYEFLKAWFKFQFKPDMTFENHGILWHIDHIIPCKHYELSNDEEKRKCFNWTNLQPLYGSENMSKKDKIYPEEISKNKINVKKFLEISTEEKIVIP